MIVVRESIAGTPGVTSTAVRVSRESLAKRRWRGVAEDGTEFGFDLESPLADGAVIHRSVEGEYVIRQTPEPVLEVNLPDAGNAARLGWMIGNLHFAVEVTDSCLRTVDDPAVRQMFAREDVAFAEAVKVFKPLASGGHRH